MRIKRIPISFWIAFILYPLDSLYPYPTSLILFALFALSVCVRLLAPSFSYDNICRFMPFGVSTDKTIWISVKWSHTRSAIAVWNGYVNRFCCRLFAAYFLQMVLPFFALFSVVVVRFFFLLLQMRAYHPCISIQSVESVFMLFTQKHCCDCMYVCQQIEMQWHLLYIP